MAAKKKKEKKNKKVTTAPAKLKKTAKAKTTKAKAVKAKPSASKAKASAAPRARAAKAKRPSAAAVNPLRALAKRILEVSASNDDEAVLALYAADVESTEMNMPATVGHEALQQKFAGWRSMVSSATFVPKNVWVDGKTIVVEWSGDCVLAGSGKQVQLREIAIHEIENGKIKRERYYYDPAALQP